MLTWSTYLDENYLFSVEHLHVLVGCKVQPRLSSLEGDNDNKWHQEKPSLGIDIIAGGEREYYVQTWDENGWHQGLESLEDALLCF